MMRSAFESWRKGDQEEIGKREVEIIIIEGPKRR